MVTTESPASRDSPITLSRKQTGKPIAGNRHDGFDVAGAGTQLTVRLMRHSERPTRLVSAGINRHGVTNERVVKKGIANHLESESCEGD